ncbi:hypothetical protein IT775_20375 [Thalassobius aquimarinus]|uniref:Uncharacterized protein n=1 Tax=Thalassovita aquimarina TaxID=2785917 RepID=A0ABS5HWY6_9RHOB|nr:hypothetical protein [Thalassovita aquimarina]
MDWIISEENRRGGGGSKAVKSPKRLGAVRLKGDVVGQATSPGFGRRAEKQQSDGNNRTGHKVRRFARYLPHQKMPFSFCSSRTYRMIYFTSASVIPLTGGMSPNRQ